jgi:dihydroorotase
MVARDIALAELTGGWLHLAHVSTANSVDMVRQAKMRGVRVTAEATPHHLTLTDYWVAGENGRNNLAFPLTTLSYDTSTKVNPPLRSGEDVSALVQGVRDGIIDVIATDHAPHTVIDKDTTYDEAAFGISNLETSLGSLLSLVHLGQLDLLTIIECLSSAPARLLGTRGEKLGTLSPGAMADVVLFDVNYEWMVDVGEFVSKGINTPLKGQKLKGRVMTTIVAGEIRYQSDFDIKP